MNSIFKTNSSNEYVKGFTLVEVSIVLLIVSILLGGVIKTAEFIENSKVDRLINDLEAFQISYYAYYDRFGDFPGNGSAKNRFINLDLVGVNDGTFFSDLFAEGFIKSAEPLPSLGGVGNYFVNYLSFSDSVGVNTGAVLGKNQACITEIKASYSYHLDFQLDDGVWNTGSVRTTAPFNDLETHTLCLEI